MENHKLFKLETARFHFHFGGPLMKVEPSDMLDFDRTERGTQNSAIFDLGICFLWETGSSDFRHLEFCMNPASSSEETKYSDVGTKKIKVVEQQGKNNIGNINCNDPLENFINENKIKCYKYSEFKHFKPVDRGDNLVRGNHFNELKWNDKLNLAFQLASAVSYLHDSSIIHCDLYTCTSKYIKLAGFGLPSEASNETSNPLHLFDVILYMDPKRLEIANYDLDKRSDVYSVGALLWQISSGRKPFHAENYDISLSSAIYQGKREDDIDGTPIVYSNLYKECWNYEPDKRPDMKEVVSIIRSVLVQTQSTINIQEEIKDDATEWVEDILKNAKVEFISFKDLKDPVSLGEGGFGRTIKAIWSYVVYKRLINTTAITKFV
ncbi:kinase-like protein [Rhizophagus irregularis]|uniref:Kinase-like protein n=1 Tax=Rhizophagus irregularis TaxID=588596 RepID=A0A2I1FUZ0_9GLOM|nr:kinase-like protein [Rhizophagus irregularis]